MLRAGTRFGPYEVLSSIGSGGMGEVYRARDARLNRDVAIKILPEALAADPDRAMRFTREAQTLAALNHPHIAQIYGVEESPATSSGQAGIRALVMELVEGETLAERIARGPMALDDAIPIARQIADALEGAHEAGIIHRDLKPANIKLRPDGTVKVLDFGLAKAREVASGASRAAAPGGGAALDSPTFTSPAVTHAGVILGTAPYMSPEQAKGKPVDRRADIWAFGCILYEMLTARVLFGGETVTETLARVIEREPDLTPLPATTPAALRELIARCVQRDTRRRLRDIGEARVLLEQPIDIATASTAMTTRGSRAGLGLVVVATAAVTAAAVVLLLRASDRPEMPHQRRLTLPTPNDAAPLLNGISPDGMGLLVVAGDKLWLQTLDNFSATEVEGSEGAHAPFWSPDSQWFGFQARGQLWKVSRAGGRPQGIARVPDFTFAGGAAWLADGRIVFGTGGTGLYEIAATGGDPKPLLPLDEATEADFHNVSPLDGQSVIYSVHPTTGNYTIEIFDTVSKSRQAIFTATPALLTHPVYSPTGHVLFNQRNGVWALPFELGDRRATGEPFLVMPNARQPSIASDATLVMLPDNASGADARLRWVDRSGKTLRMLGDARGTLSQPRVSADGRFVVVVRGSGAEADLWIYDIARATERRLTFENGPDRSPLWSKDGEYIVYQCQATICSRRADGTGSRVELVDAPAVEPELSPDGQRLVFDREVKPGDSDIFAVDLTATGLNKHATAAPRTIISAPRVQASGAISPDGRYIAYSSSEGGTFAVLVSEFPSGAGKWQVPLGYSTWPRWSAKGDRLFVADELGRIVEYPVTLSPAFSIGAVTVRIEGNGLPGKFDRSADGNEFLIAAPASGVGTARLLMIQNWRPEEQRTKN